MMYYILFMFSLYCLR